MHTFIFILALVNSALLIAIFIARKMSRMEIVRILGIVYMLLAVPAVFAIIAYPLPTQHIIFLAIFLVYLLLECLFDFILKLDFRRNWKLLVPYLLLYYAMNYGFFVMAYRGSQERGIIVLSFTLAQIAVNLWSHRPFRQRR